MNPEPQNVADYSGRQVEAARRSLTLVKCSRRFTMPLSLSAVGYAMGRIEVLGRDWVGRQATRLQAKGPISPDAIVLLYLGLPEDRSAWTDVAARGPAVEAAYWKRARGHRSKSAEDAAFAVTKLVDANRPDAALSIAGDPKVSIPSAVLLRLLQAFLSFDPKKTPVDGTMLRYYLEQVFKQLYDRDELSAEELARIEWPFAQILGDELGRHTSGPLAIHRVLQRDPSFFAQLVAFLYKRDDGNAPSGSDGDRARISAIRRSPPVT